MKKISKKDFFTIPNLLSYLRILLIPVFCVLYVNAYHSGIDSGYYWAAAVVAFSSITDLFDGMIARKFNQITDLGKFLDPLADKLTHAALAFCLAVKYPLMWALIGLMAVKEGFMAVMGIIFLRKGRMLDGAKWFGKVCTAMLFIGLFVLFLFPHIPEIAANIILIVLMAAMLFTLIQYIPVFLQMKKETDEAEKGAKK